MELLEEEFLEKLIREFSVSQRGILGGTTRPSPYGSLTRIPRRSSGGILEELLGKFPVKLVDELPEDLL